MVSSKVKDLSSIDCYDSPGASALQKNVTIDPELPCDYTQSISGTAAGQANRGRISQPTQNFSIDASPIHDGRLMDLPAPLAQQVGYCRANAAWPYRNIPPAGHRIAGQLRRFSVVDSGIGRKIDS